ncbi:hypothetical protein OG320_11530 [Microbispora sp. NBC_01189]|uniref:hypothetical protein n=1 Tax=Microbispora sp. NBC_01189 TaxID=2903583 RepID=UPI002E0D4196|nr:hypothetical protein OG320_11530 [Microbispora sp. NBC_01189]
MPSPQHDTLNLLFRNRPRFALEMCQALRIPVPEDLPVQVVSNELNDRPSIDLHPDTVVTVGPRHHPVHAIVVEIQQRQDAAKRVALPRYAAALWLQVNCPVTVLVICPDRRTADWAAEPIDTSLPGFQLKCGVIGPAEIPPVTKVAQAAEHPELAALSVMSHGDDISVVRAFISALEYLPDDHAPQYYEYAYRLASEVARRVMEEMMESTTWPVYSPFARQHYGRGREEGREEGRAEGEARAVLTILEVRNIPVSEDDRTFIMECTNLERLDEWARRAVTATSVADLFTEES